MTISKAWMRLVPEMAVCRECRVFTLAEIGRLTEALGPTVLEAKRVFPGATVSGIRKPEIDWKKGDDIPF